MKKIIQMMDYIESNWFPIMSLVFMLYVFVEASSLVDLEASEAGIVLPSWLSFILASARFIFLAILEYLFTMKLSVAIYNIATDGVTKREVIVLFISIVMATACTFVIWLISCTYQGFIIMTFTIENGIEINVPGGQLTGKFISITCLVFFSLIIGGFFLPSFRMEYEKSNGIVNNTEKKVIEVKESKPKEEENKKKEEKDDKPKEQDEDDEKESDSLLDQFQKRPEGN